MKKTDFSKLKARKLDENDQEVNRLIELTIKEQRRVLALTKIDYAKLSIQYITI